MNDNDRFNYIYKTVSIFFNGDREAAKIWINKPVKGLGNRKPIDMIKTDDETYTVIALIGRLEHGVFN